MIPTSCPCGQRFYREVDAVGHTCPPNNTGFTVGETVRVGDATGQVITVSSDAVEVYFRQIFAANWYTAAQLEQVPA